MPGPLDSSLTPELRVRPALDVWCFGDKAGLLTDNLESLDFQYEEVWRDAGRPPLSQSLPLDGSFSARAVGAFFGGLLPEGDIRAAIAGWFGVSDDNDFSLLEKIGGDCAGAISLYPPGLTPADRPPGIDWLEEEDLERSIVDLPRRPMILSEQGEYRLSLAGVQDKLPVVAEEGRLGLPVGSQPSSHIIKAPISWLSATVLNEAFCLAVGRELGLECVDAEPRRIGDAEFLLVERYDRVRGLDGTLMRLHQEDFCQALGIPSARKYENEGGPSLVNCVELVRQVSRTPAEDLPRFLDSWALSYLAGNHDAHGKNYSLLYDPEGTRLAPAYDVLSSISYLKIEDMDKKMAMKVGGENRPDYLRSRHIDRFLKEAGLGRAASRRRLGDLAARASAAVSRVSDRFARLYWWDEAAMNRVVEVFTGRARHLQDEINKREDP